MAITEGRQLIVRLASSYRTRQAQLDRLDAKRWPDGANANADSNTDAEGEW